LYVTNANAGKMKINYETAVVAGVSIDLPGIYEWRFYDLKDNDRMIAVYVGKCVSARQRLKAYERDVAEIIQNATEGRAVCDQLFTAHMTGARVQWVYLENVVDEIERGQREQALTYSRREQARQQGFKVLNATFLEETQGAYEAWRKQPFFAPHLTVERLVQHNPRRPIAKDYSTIEYYNDARTVQDFIDICVDRGTYNAYGVYNPLTAYEAHKISTWDFTKGFTSVGGVRWHDLPRG
jgi:hypothetical protein